MTRLPGPGGRTVTVVVVLALLSLGAGPAGSQVAAHRTACLEQETETKYACVWSREPMGHYTATCTDPTCRCVPQHKCIQGGTPKKIFVCKNQSGGLCEGLKKTATAADLMTQKSVIRKATNELSVDGRRHRRATGEDPVRATGEDTMPGVLTRIIQRHRQYNERSFQRGTFFLHGFSRRSRAYIRKRMNSHDLNNGVGKQTANGDGASRSRAARASTPAGERSPTSTTPRSA